MASNPFGITQVDIPSLLGIHQQAKQRRLEEMYKSRQFEIEERKQDRQDKKDAVLARVFAKGGDPSSGSVGAPIASPAGSAPTAPVAHPLDNHPIGQSLPARTDGLTLNQGALQELYALDPEAASQVQKMVYDADERTLKQATARGEAMAIAADALRNLPAGQRQAEYQAHWAPWLADHGFGPQQLQNVDLSDQSLNRFWQQGRTLAQTIQDNKPDVRVLPAGATLYDMKASRTVATNGAPQTLPPDFDFDDGGPTQPASGGF